jgi:hypothetical protein
VKTSLAKQFPTLVVLDGSGEDLSTPRPASPDSSWARRSRGTSVWRNGASTANLAIHPMAAAAIPAAIPATSPSTSATNVNPASEVMRSTA